MDVGEAQGGEEETDMESKRNRTGCAVLAAGLIAFSCIALIFGIAAVSLLTGWSFAVSDWDLPLSGAREVIERSFEVAEGMALEIDNFAGSVNVRAEQGDKIEVVATKRARTRSNVERIDVDMSERGNTLVIKTERPPTLRNAWVELEITAPPDTQLHLLTGSGSVDVRGLTNDVRVDTGSGSVSLSSVEGDIQVDSGSGSLDVTGVRGDVRASTATGSIDVDGVSGNVALSTGSGGIDLRNVSGKIDAHTSSGKVEARGVDGPVSLDSGSGGIEYQGRPEGECRFTTGSGSVKLILPSGLDSRVDLHTGSGSIDLDFAVDGRVTRRDVEGVIGSGDDVEIYARTGSGGIDLLRR